MAAPPLPETAGPAGQGLPTLRTEGKRPVPRLWLVCADVWNELWTEAPRSAERHSITNTSVNVPSSVNKKNLAHEKPKRDRWFSQDTRSQGILGAKAG